MLKVRDTGVLIKVRAEAAQAVEDTLHQQVSSSAASRATQCIVPKQATRRREARLLTSRHCLAPILPVIRDRHHSAPLRIIARLAAAPFPTMAVILRADCQDFAPAITIAVANLLHIVDGIGGLGMQADVMVNLVEQTLVPDVLQLGCRKLLCVPTCS